MRQTPKDIEETSWKMTRRGLVVGGLQLSFMAMLGLRMRQLQIEEADQYRLLAEENRVNIRLIAPPRGIIYDRNGVIIADSNQPLEVTESRHHPVWYLPMADVNTALLTATEHATYCPFKGHASYWSIYTDAGTLDNAISPT